MHEKRNTDHDLDNILSLVSTMLFMVKPWKRKGLRTTGTACDYSPCLHCCPVAMFIDITFNQLTLVCCTQTEQGKVNITVLYQSTPMRVHESQFYTFNNYHTVMSALLKGKLSIQHLSTTNKVSILGKNAVNFSLTLDKSHILTLLYIMWDNAYIIRHSYSLTFSACEL